MSRLIVDLQNARRTHVGGKAASIARLRRLGFSVPHAWAVPSKTVARMRADPDAVVTELLRQLDKSATYAVRSSAEVEDSGGHSFAGRFLTELDVPAAEVPASVARVGSCADEALDAYAEALGVDACLDTIGVVIQEMVHARAAGVVFSRNPVTSIKETVIEAVEGTADELLAGRQRPERWVRKRGEWLLTPDEPVLDAAVAAEIADGAERLEQALGYCVDAEWAWDGTLWWLQARPVTAGSQAAVYSSKLARDMLPGIVTPLVWSINGPLNSGAFLRFLEDVFGRLDARPEDLSALFHYRMYINVGALSKLFAEFGMPEESLEMLAGMERRGSMSGMPRPTPRALVRMPHMLGAMRRFSRFDRELDVALPPLERQVREFVAETDPNTLAPDELLARIATLRELLGELAYRHLVTLMVMQMFTMRLRAAMERAGALEPGQTMQLPGGDSHDGDCSPALWALGELATRQPAEVQAAVHHGDLETLRALPDAGDLVAAIDRFIADFGHLSDSGVNFAAPAWREQPEQVLTMIAAHMDTGARLSSTREAFERDYAVGPRLRRAYRRALVYQSCRDRTSALYTYAYGQFRPHVLSLGRHLEEAGTLSRADDVFYLTIEELARLVEGSLAPADTRAMVAQRAEEIEFASQGEPPEVVVGEVAELVRMPSRKVLRGTPTSRGRYTGRTVVCHGIADLPRIARGDVVVVPFSDASWAPLFTRAGAIVAESGGVLSHSAILARELGLPAVVSVRGALALADGALVSVDGFEGTVTVLDEAS